MPPITAPCGMNFMHAWHRPDSVDLRRIGSVISPGASCCPANAWSACSTLVLPSLKSASLPPATCTTAKCPARERSEEHTSELQSLMRISYAVFCLKKKNNNNLNDSIIHGYHYERQAQRPP